MNKRKALLGTFAGISRHGRGQRGNGRNQLSDTAFDGIFGRFRRLVRRKGALERQITSGRRVAVYRSSPGSDPSIGSTTTSGSGNWGMVTGKPRRGDYYAKVSAKSVGGGIHCAGARTATTHVS